MARVRRLLDKLSRSTTFRGINLSSSQNAMALSARSITYAVSSTQKRWPRARTTLIKEVSAHNYMPFMLYLPPQSTDTRPGLSRQAIFTAVEASLGRLDTPYIDLLQIHRFDASVPIEETMEALHDLVKSGKVRYIGASSMWATQFAQMQFVAEKHGWTKFVSMQNCYNLLYREEEREMNRYCDATGVGLIPVRVPCINCRFYRGRADIFTVGTSLPRKPGTASYPVW